MTDKRKRGPGRPPGAINRKRVPKDSELLKLAKQGMEMGMKHLMDILTDPDSTEKQKEVAADRLTKLGQSFLMADLKEGLNPKDSEGGEEKQEPSTSEAVPIQPKGNIYAVSDYKKEQ